MQQPQSNKEILDKNYAIFVREAELFFVTNFIDDESIKEEYSFCLDVLFNITGDEKIDYTKGIIAYNKNYGQGKSFFFEVVYHQCKRVQNKNIFKYTTAKELASIYKNASEKPEEALLEFISVKNLFIDDIGDEFEKGCSPIFHNYNNSLNVLRFVLLKRYEMWLKHKGRWRTFGTTNIDLDIIAKIYDGRLSDRLLQMTYFRGFDFLEEGSFRQLTSTRRLTSDEIAANLRKLQPEKKTDVIDEIAYLNGLLLEKDDFLKSMAVMDWKYIKEMMLKYGFMNRSVFDKINDEKVEAMRLFERQRIRWYVESVYKFADYGTQKNRKEEGYANITKAHLIELCENEICESYFIELKKDKEFKFNE